MRQIFDFRRQCFARPAKWEKTMPTFTGRLTVFSQQSTLAPPTTNFLLLKAGIPDPAQAQFAATFFLLQTRQLHSGQFINVQGTAGKIGSVNAIAMTNASAAGPSPFDVGPTALAAAKKSSKKQRTAKKSSKKRSRKSAKKK